MRILLLALTLALAACSGSSTTSSSTTSSPSPDPVDNSGGDTAGATECASNDDCVVSCAAPEQCCDAQLCPPCQQVYTRAELAEIEAWRAGSCAAESCPVAKCMAPTEEAVAVCNAGQCEIQMAPILGD